MTADQPSMLRLASVAPALQRNVEAAMQQLAAVGVYFRVAQGLRTAEEQNAWYAQGRTTPGHIVTDAQARYSNHNFGCAVDCFPFVMGDAGALDLTGPAAPEFVKMVHVLSLQGLHGAACGAIRETARVSN